LILLLFGPPGCGKGTQAAFLAEHFHIPAISTGEVFRAECKAGTPLGKMACQIMAKGGLVGDDIVNGVVANRLTRPDCAGGFVFDGFPRTLPQAEQLDKILEARGFGKPQVVDFCVSPEELVKRISGRWMCSVGGEIYNIHEAPPKVAGICDRDGGKLVQRADDRPEAVKERLVVYERQTKPLTEYYRRRGVLDLLDAGAPVEEVSRALEKLVKCS